MARELPPGNAGKIRRVPVAARRERLAELVLVRSPLTESQAELFRDVFPVIMEMHYGQVWAQLTRRGVNEAKAEDLLLDVFELFHRKVRAEGFPECIPAKLRALTRGKILNHVRDEARVPFSLGLPTSSQEVPPTGPGVDSAAGARELAAKLLPSLSDEHADVVELGIVVKLSHPEAAEELDIPLGTFKSRLKAAKARLIELVNELLAPGKGPAS